MAPPAKCIASERLGILDGLNVKNEFGKNSGDVSRKMA
jgi:hypothetical protein